MKRNRELLIRYSKLINFFLEITSILPKKIFIALLNFLRPYDGRVIIFIRYICLKNCAKNCGDNVAIFSNVYIYNIDSLTIGDNVSIHPMCYIQASGGIEIGNDVSIAHATTIMSEEHKYKDKNINIKDQGCEFIKTKIENNVWVGAGSKILAGSHIKTGSIVAAGAVVKGEIPENTICGGVPARILKKRI